MRSAWQLAWRLVRGTIGQNRDLQFWEFYSGPISHRFETPYVGFVEPLQSGVPDLPSPLIGIQIQGIDIKKTRTFWRGGPAERLSDGPVYDPRNRV